MAKINFTDWKRTRKKIKEVTHDWAHLNSMKLLWMRKYNVISQDESYSTYLSPTTTKSIPLSTFQLKTRSVNRVDLDRQYLSSVGLVVVVSSDGIALSAAPF